MSDEKPQSIAEYRDFIKELQLEVLDGLFFNEGTAWKTESRDNAKNLSVEQLKKFEETQINDYCIALKTDDFIQHFPKVWHDIIEPGIKMANEKGKIYKAPERPKYIILDNMYKDCYYDLYNHFIKLGLPYLFKLESKEEAASLVSHEWGHAYDLLNKRVKRGLVTEETLLKEHPEDLGKTFAPNTFLNHDSEFTADRYSYAKTAIPLILSQLINKPYLYDYLDKEETHPSYRKRLGCYVEEMLGNDILGMNGKYSLSDEPNKNHFASKVLFLSPENVQKNVRKQIGYDRIKPSYLFDVAEDGRLIRDYDSFKCKIEEKAEELLQILDPIVNGGDFSSEKKAQWLEIMDAEVAKFREENKPELFEGKYIPLGGFASGIRFERKLTREDRQKLGL